MLLRGSVAAVPALALLSVALPATVQHDAGGWVDWGRELLHGSLDTVWYPSWKPLPVLITAPAALAGSAAPTIWLVAARAGAIAGVLLAAWTAERAAGRLAGVVAGIAVVFTPGWLEYALAGLVEPTVLALVLGALACAVRQRPRVALGLLALAALGRVEAWPLLLGAAGWCVWRRTDRLLAAALVALVPALWLGGDWLGSGDPMRGGFLARLSGEAAAAARAGEGVAALGPALATMVPVPVLLLACAAVTLGVRARSRVEPALAGAVVAWVGADAVLVSRGFAPSARFLLPAAGLLTVLAADGLLRGLRALPTAPRGIAAATCLLAVVVVHWSTARTEVAEATWFARAERSLGRAVTAAGGPAAIRACGGATTLEAFRPYLAWRLDEGTTAVRPRAGLVFVLPHPGPPAPPAWTLAVHRPGAAVPGLRGRWRVLRHGAARRLGCRAAAARPRHRRARTPAGSALTSAPPRAPAPLRRS